MDHRLTCTLHGDQCTADRRRREDLEPQLGDLLNDPILSLLMKSDGLSRADLERIIDNARRRLSMRKSYAVRHREA